MAQMPVADAVENVASRPANPRSGDVAAQIKQDLGELIDALDKPNANFAALPYIYGARMGYFGSNEWAPEFRASYGGEIELKDVKVLESQGNRARASVTYSLNFRFGKGALKERMKHQQETLDFRLVALPLEPQTQKWQIVPPSDEPADIGAGNSDVLWSNVAYHLAQKRSLKIAGSLAQRSTVNLKQLGLGALMFVQDYDGVYAFEPRYLSEAIAPYVGNEAIFRVPDTNEIYAMNGNISGLNFEQLKSINKTVLFYEGQNEKPIFRYDSRAAICFADGHVALVTPEEAKNLIWTP